MRQMEENARQNAANAAEKPQAIIDQEELNRKTVEEARRYSQESARQNAATREPQRRIGWPGEQHSSAQKPSRTRRRTASVERAKACRISRSSRL